MVSKSHSKVSLTKQCKILGLCRSALYTKRKGESALNLELMDKMDKHYLKHPYKGCPRMYTYLTLDEGYNISYNRVSRLYYIGVRSGYMYLMAIIDLYSRYVVGWDLSNTMAAEWCTEVLRKANQEYGNPEIINTDQGSQFTSVAFSKYVLEEAKYKLSMDGKGRATDNAFIERLWRSVKYEKIHLHKPEDGLEAYMLLLEYFDYYNNERRHSSIGQKRPIELYNLGPNYQHSNTPNNRAQKLSC